MLVGFLRVTDTLQCFYYYYYAVFNAPYVCQSMTKLQARDLTVMHAKAKIISTSVCVCAISFDCHECCIESKLLVQAVHGMTVWTRR